MEASALPSASTLLLAEQRVQQAYLPPTAIRCLPDAVLAFRRVDVAVVMLIVPIHTLLRTSKQAEIIAWI